MRGIKRAAAASAIAATGIGLLAAPAVAATGHAGAAKTTRHAFHCTGVTNDHNKTTYCAKSTHKVGSGDKIRVAVRGSKGRSVRFHAWRNGTQTGSWSHTRKGGQSSVYVWKNTSKKTVKVYLRAQIRGGSGSQTVSATEYIG